MHELSIAQSLFDIVLEESNKNNLKHVNVIKLQIGALAAVVPEALTFCFELVTKDTVAEGAALEIDTVPIVARCAKCDFLFEVENHIFVCPQCDEPTMDLVSGRDLALMSIEGETGDDDDADQSSSGPKHSSGE